MDLPKTLSQAATVRNCTSSLLSLPFVVYWHQANQSQHWPSHVSEQGSQKIDNSKVTGLTWPGKASFESLVFCSWGPCHRPSAQAENPQELSGRAATGALLRQSSQWIDNSKQTGMTWREKAGFESQVSCSWGPRHRPSAQEEKPQALCSEKPRALCSDREAKGTLLRQRSHRHSAQAEKPRALCSDREAKGTLLRQSSHRHSA